MHDQPNKARRYRRRSDDSRFGCGGGGSGRCGRSGRLRLESKPLTAYKQCCEPHAGVDLIIVRSDDTHVQYDDSYIAADGRVTQPVLFTAPGRYRVVVDAYPKQAGPQSPFNFQLFTWVTVRGAYRPQAAPPRSPTQVVDGYRFQIQGHPRLKAIEANFLTR